MDEFEMRRIICDYIKEICHYSQMQVFSTSSYQSKYFQLQIDDTTSGLINFFLANSNYVNTHYSVQQIQPPTQPQAQQPIQQPVQQPVQQPIQQPIEQPAQQPVQQGTSQVTKEELAASDGSDGKPAYVAVNGVVYDMSKVIQWSGGTHFGLYAGHNLSSEFMGCHSGMEEILQKLPRIGELEQ